MHVTKAVVEAEYEWLHERGPVIVPLANRVRRDLGAIFETEVAEITLPQYESAIDAVFTDGALAVNVAAITAMLKDLDVDGDYPGFIVDEYLGRELAALLAGEHPNRMLAEATFHFADIHHDHDDEVAGADDLDAAIAAGVQTRLPGWEWTESDPFAIGVE